MEKNRNPKGAAMPGDVSNPKCGTQDALAKLQMAQCPPPTPQCLPPMPQCSHHMPQCPQMHMGQMHMDKSLWSYQMPCIHQMPYMNHMPYQMSCMPHMPGMPMMYWPMMMHGMMPGMDCANIYYGMPNADYAGMYQGMPNMDYMGL